MTIYRKRMLEEMQLRRFSARAQRTYLRAVEKLCRFCGKAPPAIGANPGSCTVNRQGMVAGP